MANLEQMRILEQGPEVWNEWRAKNRFFRPDLRGANLRDRDLRGYNLHDTIIGRVDHHSADLSGANLEGVNLSRADLRTARLVGANLTRAILIHAHLLRTHLDDAVLISANLESARIDGAYLLSADFSGANLRQAHLNNARLGDLNMHNAVLTSTIFSNTDLSEPKSLKEVVHEGPSFFDIDTLALTLRSSGGRFTPEQLVFFEGAGVPRTLLEYLPSIFQTEPLQFYSCFISYSTKDEGFATKLNQDLNKAGVRTWKWDMDAMPGRYLRDSIDEAIRDYDKLILICSVNSLISKAVDREIETALQKEEQRSDRKAYLEGEALLKGNQPPSVDTNVLVPIRLDDTVFNWRSSLAPQVKRYYIPDFSDAPPGGDKYTDELQKLICALNPKSWPPLSPKS